MEEFNEGILPFLESSDIKYVDDGVPKSMSVDYFRNNFTRLTTNELLNIGQYSYYYQSSEFPELILRFRFSASAGVTIMMMAYNDFEKQMKTLEDFQPLLPDSSYTTSTGFPPHNESIIFLLKSQLWRVCG